MTSDAHRLYSEYMDNLPLYWTDPDLMETTAAVISAEPTKTGWKLVLDRQLFYPGGGGQPADRGFVDDCPVTAIKKIDNVIQMEITSAGEYASGDELKCTLDSRFRTDSRQQHSGQHLLSSALSLEGLDTVSVHLGSDYTGIEVTGNSNETISENSINKVLKTCDRWIQESRKINSLYLKPEELKGLELRRSLSDKSDKGSAGLLRIMEIDGVDRVGCGGVHLNNTSSIGLILFAGSEKMRGHIRLNWLIGDRAREHARFLNRQGQEIQKLLSAGPDETTDRISSILEENKKNRLSLKKSDREIGRLMAGSWSGTEKSADKVISENVSGSKDRIEGAVEVLLDSDVRIAFLISGDNESAGFSWILLDKAMANTDFNEFKSGFLATFNGTGGGKPPLWRGRVEGVSEEILRAFRKWRKS